MTPEKVFAVITMYEERLQKAGVRKKRMYPYSTFAALAPPDLLAHAHYLCDGAKEYARDPERWGKANRHLTAIQMCLSFAGWYTLAELMEHNRS